MACNGSATESTAIAVMATPSTALLGHACPWALERDHRSVGTRPRCWRVCSNNVAQTPLMHSPGCVLLTANAQTEIGIYVQFLSGLLRGAHIPVNVLPKVAA